MKEREGKRGETEIRRGGKRERGRERAGREGRCIS